jgi:fatty acid desaturase
MTMPAAPAARVKPEDFFSSEEWQSLSARSNWVGLVLVAHCWLVIAAAMAIGVIWPITIPLAVMLIGNRQLGLFILMHDAAHGALHANRRVNDFVGKWFCGTDLHAYRAYHLQHHRFVQQTDDPDLILSAPFPISRNSLKRKMIRDLTGQTFFKQRLGALTTALKARKPDESLLAVLIVEIKRQPHFYFQNAVGLLLFSAAGLWWAWVLMWLLPMMTWLPLITRLRNISEHALVAQNEPDPLRHARTTHANFLERVLIAPYWVNYHCEHHMFTQIACWKLPLAHTILERNNVAHRMELQPGYWAMLRLASAG